MITFPAFIPQTIPAPGMVVRIRQNCLLPKYRGRMGQIKGIGKDCIHVGLGGKLVVKVRESSLDLL
jgi:hypothetical protein